MLKNLFRHKLQIVIVILLVALFAVIRMYEDALFYDPLLSYFKTNFSGLPLPEIDKPLLFFSLLLRYTANTVLSLALIFVIFRKIELVKFAAFLFVGFFIILAASFFVVLEFSPENKMTLFYIRRFLIQPLFVLLFIPAFYFQERNSKK